MNLEIERKYRVTDRSYRTGATRCTYYKQGYLSTIPVADAAAMLDGLCQSGLIEKKRYLYPYAGHTWEVDEFMGDNEGLVVAEVELQSESESIALPPFIGREVTGDSRYYNSNLAKTPYRDWDEKE